MRAAAKVEPNFSMQFKPKSQNSIAAKILLGSTQSAKCSANPRLQQWQESFEQLCLFQDFAKAMATATSHKYGARTAARTPERKKGGELTEGCCCCCGQATATRAVAATPSSPAPLFPPRVREEASKCCTGVSLCLAKKGNPTNAKNKAENKAQKKKKECLGSPGEPPRPPVRRALS